VRVIHKRKLGRLIFSFAGALCVGGVVLHQLSPANDSRHPAPEAATGKITEIVNTKTDALVVTTTAAPDGKPELKSGPVYVRKVNTEIIVVPTAPVINWETIREPGWKSPEQRLAEAYPKRDTQEYVNELIEAFPTVAQMQRGELTYREILQKVYDGEMEWPTATSSLPVRIGMMRRQWAKAPFEEKRKMGSAGTQFIQHCIREGEILSVIHAHNLFQFGGFDAKDENGYRLYGWTGAPDILRESWKTLPRDQKTRFLANLDETIKKTRPHTVGRGKNKTFVPGNPQTEAQLQVLRDVVVPPKQTASAKVSGKASKSQPSPQ
jgi:hypothetical protein